MHFRALILALVAASALGNVLPQQEAGGLSLGEGPVVIDGIHNTVGLTLSNYFSGNWEEIFEKVIEWIAKAIDPPPTADIDYFAVIAKNVRNVVGEYVNKHNMDQILHYKGDLAELLSRYANAPNKSETYPDKNTIANSLSVSMVSNRFLIEAVDYPDSMMLHYADLASLHVAVLRNAAQTYTVPEKTSFWWVDLDDQLEHYIGFGTNLTSTLVQWRNDMVDCSNKQCVSLTCYDIYTVVDKVEETVDTCKALHKVDHSCDTACANYKTEMNDTVQKFIAKYLGEVLAQWKEMKKTSAVMADKARNGH